MTPGISSPDAVDLVEDYVQSEHRAYLEAIAAASGPEEGD